MYLTEVRWLYILVVMFIHLTYLIKELLNDVNYIPPLFISRISLTQVRYQANHVGTLF